MHSTPRKPHLAFGSASGRSFINFRISRRTALNAVLTMAVMALVVFGAVWGGKKLWAQPEGSIGTTYQLRPGPWGEISAQPILIEAPSSLLSVNFRLGDGLWYLPANSPEEAAAFLRGAGLSSAQISRITSDLRPVEGRDGLLAAAPPEDLVRSLSMETRSDLYNKLAAIPENFAQAEPFRTSDLHLDAWLDEDKLPPELIDEVKSLMWRRGSGLFFSDYNIVADKISSPELKLTLLEQLTHKASVILSLDVPSGSGIEEIVRYYSANGRNDKVEPLLRGLSEAGGGPIGIANILPSFARVRLYRFPEPLPGKDISQDCHWATFNFFNRALPDERLNDPAFVEEVLREKYTPVTGAPQFGDVVLLTLPDGSAIHSATYIADNMVFTKNGPSLAAPFIFSTSLTSA